MVDIHNKNDGGPGKSEPLDFGTDDFVLDDFFAAAKAEAPQPSDDLMSRIMADADAVAAERAAAVSTRVRTPRRNGLLRAALAALGGWGAVAALSTAAVAGVGVGLSSPDTLYDLSSLYLGTSAELSYSIEDVTPGYFEFLEEG
ncbi:dihydroorotate dehydrogenase [Candidatus Halocynthiibacter alkanivorans]|jgi:hypothetical protein|uniref:dihydroorotate dehydrogenase n=1 Tax=Candidatus Halocynthiibacter alkanivorans TaxID=2267619 RepID=UPI001F17D286|nr:dihydroorotate dehydrogenase [Candidatus Halocynthiibacter alkanivorans]